VELRSLVSVISFCILFLATSQVGLTQYMCVPTGAVETRMGTIGVGDPTQTSRVFRDGIPSSCGGGVPTAAPVAGSYRFDQYTFTNTTGLPACVTVDLDETACGGTANNSTQINAYTGTFDPANVMTNLAGKPGFSTIGTGSLAFPVAVGGTYVITVHEVVAGGGCASYTIRVTTRTNCDQSGFDKNGNGRADYAAFTPATGIWDILETTGGNSTFQFGQNGDIVTPGDYTGDGLTDVSVYRTNTWFYATSQASPGTNIATVPWGTAGDVPVPADYDRDGKTDIAVWRPSNGTWYILRSVDNTLSFRAWGASTDIPVTGDYDGDLIADLGVVRNEASSKRWLILQSNFGNGFVLGCPTTVPICGAGVVFGSPTDRIVSGDFDGDFKTDVSVFRPSEGKWYYFRSSSATVGNTPGATFNQTFWGVSTDIPQPADYDGDKKTDLAIFRPSTAEWWVLNSATTTPSVATIPGVSASSQPATSPYRISNP
jgi:hypothetical protein